MARDLFAEVGGARDLFAELEQPKRTGSGIGAALELGIDISKRGAEEAKRAGLKTPAPVVDPEETRRDNIRDAEIQDLQTDDGFFDRANDYLLRGRYNFESGADRVISAVQGGLGFKQASEQSLRAARRKQEVANTAIPDSTTWEDVKSNPLLAPKFIAETGLESLPGMAVAATGVGGLGIFAGSQTGNIGQQRAENNGRGDATGMDMLKAAPAAAASALLERTGITGILGSTGKNAAVRVGKAAATEGITEFGQSAIEYSGGTVGTDAGYRLGDMLDQSFAGAVGGFGVGGTIRATGELADAALRRPVAAGKREQAATSVNVEQSDVDSPLPTEAIIEGRNAAADALGMQAADSILKSAGMPETGRRVSVTIPGGEVKTGIIEDAFDEDIDGDRATGLKIRFDDGTAMREHFDTLADAGVSVTETAISEADAIDAELAARAEQPVDVPEMPVADDVAVPDIAPVAASGFVSPVGNARITSAFGKRKSPKKGASTNHGGIDYGVPEGTQVGAAAAGRVVAVGWDEKGGGKFVRVDHGNGVVTSYAHLKGASVKVGDTVQAGQQIALSGNTGNSTGAHLHFTVRVNGKTVDPATMIGKSMEGGSVEASPQGPDFTPDATAFAPQVADRADDGAIPGIVTEPLQVRTGQPIAVRAEEQADTAVTTTGRELPVRYAVAELGDLIASNDIEGRANPAYPQELQPRDRSRGVSQAQVTGIAGNLNPRLIGRSPKASDGAPIIAPDGVVESGNGRTLALRQAYANGGERIDAYKQMIAEEGFDISGMQQPVLVRIRDAAMSIEDVAAFTKEANARDTLGFSSSEQAKSDASALPAALLDAYRGGDIDAAGNRDFVRGFLQSVVAPTEYAQMVAADGTLSQGAVARVRAALLARAYNNDALVQKVTESTDSNIKAIGGALTEVAGLWAKMIEASGDGRIDPAMDISGNLNEAVALIDRARREGKPLTDFVSQRDIFSGKTVSPETESLLRLMFARPDFTRPIGQKRLVEALSLYIDQAMLTSPDGGLFGESTKAKAGDILNLAKERIGLEPDETPGLFDQRQAEPASEEPAADAGDGSRQDGGNDEGSSGTSLPSPRRESQPSLNTSEASAPEDSIDREDILAVVDANNQVKNAKKSGTEREAYRAGAADGLGVSPRSQFQYDETNALQRLAFDNGRKAAPSELKARERRADTAPTGAEDAQVQAEPVSNRDELPASDTTANIEAAVANVDTDPTDAQKESGNYRKGHVTIQGLDITIENPKGSERSGTDPNGARWSVTMPAHYGYVKRTKGADGEQIDVYIGDQPDARQVFIIDQKDAETGDFDEHKVMMGFADLDAAEETYRAGFSDGKGGQRMGGVTEMSIGEFKAWLEEEQTAPVADELFAADPAPAKSKPDQKIEDFGERLEGARKHYAEAFGDRIKAAADLDVASAPLSQTWPEPDYQKLLDTGADPYSVAAMRAMRDSIPTKPKRYGLSSWVRQTETLRALALDMLENGGVSDRFKEKLEGDFRRALGDLQGLIDLYREFGHAQSFKGISFGSHFYSLYRGEKNVTKWSITKKAKASALSNWPRELAVGDTREEVVEKFRTMLASGNLDKKKDDTIRFDIYSYRSKPGFYIGKKVGKDHIDLRHFDTAKEARDFKISDEGYAELVAELEKLKFVPSERKETNSPRVGINHRSGADVTAQQFAEAFGFRGVQFGNYVEGPRRQQDLNEAFDALMDMAGILGIEPKAISLNGKLGLAFGARGKGGKNPAKAHYEPGNIVINLTKTAGAGSLAHEWWHSLDNYFGTKRGVSPYITDATGRNETGAMRPEMLQAFRDVMAALRNTALKERSRQLDKLRTKDYWSTDIEMSARAFESYVIAKLQDEQFSNDYLANIVPEAAFGRENGYPYPTAAEIDTVRAGFDKFFDTIQSRETETGVELYSIPDTEPVAVLTGEEMGTMPRNDALRMKVLRQRAVDWYKSNLKGTTIRSSDGLDVRFGLSGQRHSTYGKGDILLRAIPALPDIIARGQPVPMPKKYRDLEGTFYAATVQIGEEKHRLGAIVRKDANGNYQYDLRLDTGSVGDGNPTNIKSADGANGTPRLEAISDANEINLLLLDEESNNASDVSESGEALADLQARLQELGIQEKIALRVVDRLGARTAGTFDTRWTMDDEKFLRGTITIALEAPQARDVTLNHEAIHAMRSLGLFRDAEWQALSRRAKADLQLMRSIKRRYSGLSEEGQIEEAIADMFAGWVKQRNQKGLASKAFDRILSFITALSAWTKGRGWTSAEDVMRSIDSGKLARRGTVEQVASDAQNAGSVKESVIDDDTALPSGFERSTTGDNLFEGHFGAVNDMLDSIGEGKSKLSDKAAKAWDEFRIKAQDRFLPLLRLQQAVERDLGRPLDESANPYMGEELMSGKIGAKLEALNDEHVQPLYDALVESDVSLDELETYLYARHAPERNKRISEINPEFEEGSGSGMTDIEAAAIMNRIENSGKMQQMKALAARVDAMLNEGVKARVDAGLMSEQDAATWSEHYKHYVPLRGRAEVEGGSLEPVRSNSGQSGISVKGKESRRAFGRRSKAESILAYSILQAQEAIARSEKNRVARQFYELAKQAPDRSFWQIDKIERRPVFNKAKGEVEYQSQTRISADDAPYTVSVKIDGVEHRITMNRDNAAAVKLATAMRNLTAQKLGWLVNIAGSINRFLSAVNTSYNPEFVVVNAFRDLQAASINLGQVEQAGIVRGVLKDYRKALAASVRGGFGSSKGEWGDWYREFVSQGGRTFFNQFDDLDQIKGRIERQMKLANDRATGRMSVRRGFEEIVDFVEKANNGVENAIRLSAYKNAREAGMTKAQAASLAKNITVNFNRRGEWGAGINAMYLFFNASVQGTATILNAAKSKRVQKMLGGIVVAGAVMELLNAAMSDDDDDGESFYDKISDFDKSRNLILMLPGQNGKFVKIPMPYGYNAIFGMGRGLAEIGRRGGDRWQESLATIAQTGIDAFNPVGGTQSLLNLIAPTVVDPIVDLYRNRDFADRPIMPEQSSFEVPDPDAQRYFGSVAPHWQALTDFLTSATGGDEVQAGAIDVSPETLEYLQGVFFGAAGQFFDRNLGLAQKLVSTDPADEISANDFSFYRKVVGDIPPWREKSVFYERIRAVEQVVDDAKDYAEREDLDGLDRLVADNEKLASMEDVVKAARKDMRAIRKERGATELAYDLGKIDDETYNEERAVFKQAEDMVIAEFNAQWVATMKLESDSTRD